MAVDLEKLSGVGLGQGLQDDAIDKLAKAWISHQLRAGEVLWKQGEPSSSIGLLYRGELQVFVDGQDIGTVRPGQIFGEASVYNPTAKRSATLRAVFPTEVLLLDRSDLDWLERDVPIFFDRLITMSLEAMAKRIRTTDKVIANLSPGRSQLPSHGIGAARTVWRSVRKTFGLQRPDLESLLSQLPHMQQATQAQLAVLASSFTADPFERGEIIIREGSQGNSLFLVGSGTVKATKNIHGHGAEDLVQFDAGDMFGLIALVKPGERTASCIGRAPGWVFTMDHRTYRSMELRSRITWKSCLASVLAVQLRIANGLVARSLVGEHGGPITGADLSRIIASAGVVANEVVDD